MALLLVAALALALCCGAARSSKKTAEAQSAATGDIPDNQVFLTFRNTAAGYSIKYPEGWAQQGRGEQVTFRRKKNVVRIVVTRASKPTTATVKKSQALRIGGSPALKTVYTVESA